MFQLMVASPKR